VYAARFPRLQFCIRNLSINETTVGFVLMIAANVASALARAARRRTAIACSRAGSPPHVRQLFDRSWLLSRRWLICPLLGINFLRANMTFNDQSAPSLTPGLDVCSSLWLFRWFPRPALSPALSASRTTQYEFKGQSLPHRGSFAQPSPIPRWFPPKSPWLCSPG